MPAAATRSTAIAEPNCAAANPLISILCQRLCVTNAQPESLLFRDLTAQLACVPLERVNARKPSTINITQAELVELTGVTKESIDKKLRMWQAAGLVRCNPGESLFLTR